MEGQSQSNGPVVDPTLIEIIKQTQRYTVKTWLPLWALLIGTLISSGVALSSFIIYDHLATPRIMRYESGRFIVETLRDIEKKEDELLRHHNQLHEEIAELERRLDKMNERLK